MVYFIVGIGCFIIGLIVGNYIKKIEDRYVGELIVKTHEDYATMQFSLGVPYVDDLRKYPSGYVKITFDDENSQDLHTM